MHCAFAASTGQSISGIIAAKATAAGIRQPPNGIPSQDAQIRKIILKRSKNNAEAIRAFGSCYSVPRNKVDRAPKGLPAYFSACGKHATRGPEAIPASGNHPVSHIASLVMKGPRPD